jgi:putative oxidoreductase
MNFDKSFLPLAGRILMAAIFVMSGIGKIANPAGTLGYINAMGLPFPELALAGAIGIEVVGGLLLIAGLYTGLVFHSAVADQNQMIHLMKNLAMAGGLLQFAAFGAGSLSLDARRGTSALRTA